MPELTPRTETSTPCPAAPAEAASRTTKAKTWLAPQARKSSWTVCPGKAGIPAGAVFQVDGVAVSRVAWVRFPPLAQTTWATGVAPVVAHAAHVRSSNVADSVLDV